MTTDNLLSLDMRSRPWLYPLDVRPVSPITDNHIDAARKFITGIMGVDSEDFFRAAMTIVDEHKPDEIIGRNGDPYMERWYIQRTETERFGEAYGYLKHEGIANVYLHRFLRSDSEDMHDHPWDNANVILRGGYTEESAAMWGPYKDGLSPTVTQDWKVAERVYRAAEDVHAIRSVQPGTVSLFVTGPKRRAWGFYVEPTSDNPTGFVPWKQYVKGNNDV